jgi:hypothetical protein
MAAILKAVNLAPLTRLSCGQFPNIFSQLNFSSMPYSALGAKACESLQADYVDYFGKNAPEFKTGGDTSVIKYLLSPQNTAGFTQIKVDQPIAGKKRSVRFAMEQPLCFDVTAPNGIVCTTARNTMSDPSKIVDFSMDGPAFRITDGGGVPLKLQITNVEMNAHCTESDQSYINRKVIKFLKRYEEALDKAVAAILATKAGTNLAGQALTQLPMFVENAATTTSVPHSDSLFQLDQNFEDILGSGQYALLGGTVLKKLQTLLKWSGLNQAGIDLTKVPNSEPYSYYSRHLNTILGANGFLQMSPGAAQLVTFNEYAGERRKEITDLYSNITVVSPSTGLLIDLQYRFDYNCGIHTWEPFNFLEVATNIAGGCGALATTNGIIKYQDCSGLLAPPACPA